MTDAERAERNRATLVQSRVPVELRARLVTEATRKRTTVSALIAGILRQHFPVARVARRG